MEYKSDGFFGKVFGFVGIVFMNYFFCNEVSIINVYFCWDSIFLCFVLFKVVLFMIFRNYFCSVVFIVEGGEGYDKVDVGFRCIGVVVSEDGELLLVVM